MEGRCWGIRMRRAVRSTNKNAGDNPYKTQRLRNNYATKQKNREMLLELKVTYLGNTVAKLRTDLASRYCGRYVSQEPSGTGK